MPSARKRSSDLRTVAGILNICEARDGNMCRSEVHDETYVYMYEHCTSALHHFHARVSLRI
jgi:hypothetical protein